MIANSATRGREALQQARAERAKECQADIQFVLTNLHVMYQEVPWGPDGQPSTEDEELAARRRQGHLDRQAQVRVHAANIYTAEQEHLANISAIAEQYNRLIGEQVEAWQGRHPHRSHLTKLTRPHVDVPADVRDFGQAALIRAVRAVGSTDGLGWIDPRNGDAA